MPPFFAAIALVLAGMLSGFVVHDKLFPCSAAIMSNKEETKSSEKSESTSGSTCEFVVQDTAPTPAKTKVITKYVMKSTCAASVSHTVIKEEPKVTAFSATIKSPFGVYIGPVGQMDLVTPTAPIWQHVDYGVAVGARAGSLWLIGQYLPTINKVSAGVAWEF